MLADNLPYRTLVVPLRTVPTLYKVPKLPYFPLVPKVTLAPTRWQQTFRPLNEDRRLCSHTSTAPSGRGFASLQYNPPPGPRSTKAQILSPPGRIAQFL